MTERTNLPWPHAPTHLVDAKGAVMFTAATYKHFPRFNSRAKLDFLQLKLFEIAESHGISLQAWAIFPNHYHFIGHIERDIRLGAFAKRLHASTATFVNKLDGVTGRQVWFQYWDSRLTFENSYYARLNYVHNNAVHHRIVKVAARYPWCSAGWFEREAQRPFRETIHRLRTDKINVYDPFDVNRSDYDLTKA